MKKISIGVLSLTLLLLLASCSTPEPKKRPRHYSEETLDFFNKVETTNSRIREVQVQERPTVNSRRDDLDSFEKIENVKIDSMPSQYSSSNSFESSAPQNTEARNESYKLPSPTAPIKQMTENEKQQKANGQLFEGKSNESLVEIEQHVSYYCMNKKNVARFKNSPELCQRYTHAVLNRCIPNKKTVNRNSVACVLKYLKR